MTRLRGTRLAANSVANRFVLDEGAGKLSFYDLSTGGKLAERYFAGAIAFLHFSQNGDRLLVLTHHQEIFVLDVRKTIEAFPPPVTGAAEDP
jgi:hypothetical protein